MHDVQKSKIIEQFKQFGEHAEQTGLEEVKLIKNETGHSIKQLFKYKYPVRHELQLVAVCIQVWQGF